MNHPAGPDAPGPNTAAALQHPDTYSAALRMLQRFGVVEVIPMERGPKGGSHSDEVPRLHRLKLDPTALRDDAAVEVVKDLRRQLGNLFVVIDHDDQGRTYIANRLRSHVDESS